MKIVGMDRVKLEAEANQITRIVIRWALRWGAGCIWILWPSMANKLEKSQRQYLADSVIALEMAEQLGTSPLAAMQSIYIIRGRQAWPAPFVIACLNAYGRFTLFWFKMRKR